MGFEPTISNGCDLRSQFEPANAQNGYRELRQSLLA